MELYIVFAGTAKLVSVPTLDTAKQMAEALVGDHPQPIEIKLVQSPSGRVLSVWQFEDARNDGVEHDGPTWVA